MRRQVTQPSLLAGLESAIRVTNTHGPEEIIGREELLRANRFKLKPESVKLRERDVVAQIVAFMETRGWFPKRNHIGAFVALEKTLAGLDKIAEAADDLEAVALAIAAARDQLFRFKITVGKKGEPDWLFVHSHYKPLWVEVKAPGESPTTDQRVFHEYLRQGYGFTVVWADSYESFLDQYRVAISASSTESRPQAEPRPSSASPSAGPLALVGSQKARARA